MYRFIELDAILFYHSKCFLHIDFHKRQPNKHTPIRITGRNAPYFGKVFLASHTVIEAFLHLNRSCVA